MPTEAKPISESMGGAAPDMQTTAQWLAEADAVLIVAGAGMSGYPSELKRNVYAVPEHFAYQYPDARKTFGIETAYQAMPLMVRTEMVPETDNWKFRAQHYTNMRFAWEPNDGYGELKKIVGAKDYFVLTSNVDGCFSRAGFDGDRIYTMQGDLGYAQCKKPCRPDAVWWAEDTLLSLRSKVLGAHTETPCENLAELDRADVPRCPHCQGTVVLNVRAGGNFIHKPYVVEQERFVAWTERVLADRKRIVVLEVGVGMNTPTVTRWPAESIIKEAGPLGALIRLNPGGGFQAEVPMGLERAIALPHGWQKLEEISQAVSRVGESEPDSASPAPRWPSHPGTGGNRHWTMRGEFDWRRFMRQLL